MPRPVNEPQVPSVSPSHARNTSSSAPIDSEQGRTHPENSNIPISSAPTSDTASGNGVSLSRDYPLHEFHSLLEAAQRIANSAPLDIEGDRWREDDQPEPIIHLNRRRTAELMLRRTQPREYTRRPHVPGEDSGSDRDSFEDEINSIMNTQREQRRANNPWRTSHPTQGASEDSSDANHPPYPPFDDDRDHASYMPLDTVNSTTFRPRPEQGRTRDRQQEEEEERDLLEQALARSRAARSRFEADNQRTALFNGQRTRYSTTGALPTSQSFYDWAPEPMSTTEPSASIFRSRSRATSIRRWRPAERLQDYASNHARRDSGNATAAPQVSTEDNGNDFVSSQPRDHDSNSIFREPEATGTLTRHTETNLGSHEDVVDRVERALQQYRIARRALRPLNVDVAFEAIPSSNATQSTFAGTSGNRTSSRNADPSENTSATAQNVSDAVDSMDYIGSAGRTEASGFGTRDYSSPSSTLRWAPSGLTRREDPMRQRIREQIRERRRRGAQQALESGIGREPPLARGPLFESAGTPQFAVPSDARQMIERVRQANMREQSPEFKRAKGALQYLAYLRDPEVDDVKAWTLAAELGLHIRSLEEEPDKNLPLSVESLPIPSSSSWLEPGIIWTGVQDANDTGEKAIRSPVTTNELSRDGLDHVSQNDSFRSRIRSIQDPLERTFLGDNTRDPADLTSSSMQMLERAEISLSSMLERSEELLRENDRQLQDNNEQLRQSRERLRDTDRRLMMLDEAVRRRAEARARQLETVTGMAHSDTSPDCDWWNVKVTLHSVDEKSMTVSGTMTASHKLHRPSYNVPSGAEDTKDAGEDDDASMDSFFTGEIIDFVRHGLDTPPFPSPSKSLGTTTNNRHRRQQDEWKVGGPEIDLSYWAGIGPFKREIDRAIRAKEDDHSRLMQVDEEGHNKNNRTAESSGQNSDSNIAESDRRTRNYLDGSSVSEEEKQTTKMDIMANLLCDTKWLNENIGAQGWILMRWKERCFVAPGTDPNPDVRRPWVSGQPRESSFPQTSAPSSQDTTPLSIAEITSQSRIRRRRERDARVWSTNAAEREELATSSGPFTSTTPGVQPSPQQSQAWGLTISGFYYVALERKTGRIEALYYDCGSTPFQKLKMSPQTMYRVPPERNPLDNAGRDLDRDQDVAMTERRDDDDRPDFSGIAGLKTSFSIVEFR